MEAASSAGTIFRLGIHGDAWGVRGGEGGWLRKEKQGVKIGAASGYGSGGRLVTIGASIGLVLVGCHSLVDYVLGY